MKNKLLALLLLVGSQLATAQDLLITNATLHTQGKNGVIENTDVLIALVIHENQDEIRSALGLGSGGRGKDSGQGERALGQADQYSKWWHGLERATLDKTRRGDKQRLVLLVGQLGLRYTARTDERIDSSENSEMALHSGRRSSSVDGLAGLL